MTGFEPIFYTDEEKLKRWIGFTATPFRRYDAPYENDQDFRLIALLGEPKYKYEMQDTIDDDNIAKPYGYFIRYRNYVPKIPPKFKNDYFIQYRMGITHNAARNAAGLAMLKYLSYNNVITLACVNKIKTGQKIIEELSKQGIKCKMICGNQRGRSGNTIFEYKPNNRGKLKLTECDGTIEDIEKAEKKYGLTTTETAKAVEKLSDEQLKQLEFEVVEKRTRRGKIFYGCNCYPKCDFALWYKPTGDICPNCKSLLVEKSKKITCSSCDYEK